MHRLHPSRRQPRGGKCPEAGPQRPTGPLSDPAAGGPDDAGDGETDMVGSRTSVRPHLQGGGKNAVVSRRRGKPCPWHTAEMARPPDLLIQTNILPSFFYLTLVPNTSLPFSVDSIHCRGRGRPVRTSAAAFPRVGRPVPLPTPGTHHHGARCLSSPRRALVLNL